jgi:hypothetical protein
MNRRTLKVLKWVLIAPVIAVSAFAVMLLAGFGTGAIGAY